MPATPTGRTYRPHSPARTRHRRLLVVALVAPLLALTACGRSAPLKTTVPETMSAGTAASGSVSTEATFPVSVTGGNGPVTISAKPKTIVSLSPSLTEMLYAIGAGGQVKAVDDNSDFPSGTPRTKMSGFHPNAEAVAGYSPDLVIASNDSNGLVASLTKLKIPVLLLPAPASLDESFSQQLVIGVATGNPGEAKIVVDRTKARIDAAVASVPKPVQAMKIYHEIDPTYYSVTSKTFIGSLYTRFGLRNIADSAPKAAGGYPQLSAEFVLGVSPQVIVLADGACCGQTPAAVAKRPGFGSVPAVAQHRVVVIKDDIASRWGPRSADFAEAVAAALHG